MINLRLFTGGKLGSRMFRDAVPAQQPHLQPLFPSVFGVVGEHRTLNRSKELLAGQLAGKVGSGMPLGEPVPTAGGLKKCLRFKFHACLGRHPDQVSGLLLSQACPNFHCMLGCQHLSPVPTSSNLSWLRCGDPCCSILMLLT